MSEYLTDRQMELPGKEIPMDELKLAASFEFVAHRTTHVTVTLSIGSEISIDVQVGRDNGLRWNVSIRPSILRVG